MAKRLSDLFKRSKEVTFEEDGEEVSVLVCKLHPLEAEEVRVKADAARARVLLARRDHSSDEYLSAYSLVSDMSSEDLVERLMAEKQASLLEQIEAELASEEEWSKDNYLEGLRTAWDDGLGERYHSSTEDEEAERVFAELSRFGAQVMELLEKNTSDYRATIESWDREKLEDRFLEQEFETRANMAWIAEYRREELYRAVRHVDDRRKLYFESRDEYRELEPEVVQRLIAALQEISVDALEGKD